jgi:hypothetical protein
VRFIKKKEENKKQSYWKKRRSWENIQTYTVKPHTRLLKASISKAKRWNHSPIYTEWFIISLSLLTQPFRFISIFYFLFHTFFLHSVRVVRDPYASACWFYFLFWYEKKYFSFLLFFQFFNSISKKNVLTKARRECLIGKF